MEDPEAYERWAAAAARTVAAFGASPTRGAEEPEGRVPLRYPFRTREQQERAQQQAAREEESPSESSSEFESEGERGRSSDGRGSDEEVDADSGTSNPASPSAAQPAQTAAQDQPANEAGSTITADMVAARDAMMFVVGAAAPVASGLPALASTATSLHVKLVWEHVNDRRKLSDERVDALSTSFRNFDRRVAAGWLCGDLMRGPALLERDDAHTLGLKIKYEAGKVEAKETKLRRDAKKAAGRLAAADPGRGKLLERAEEEIETLLGTTVQLPLPAASQAAQAPNPARPQKRPREIDPLEAAEAAELECRKATKRAGAALERAERDEAEKLKVVIRMTERLEKLEPKSEKHANHWINLTEAAEQRWHAAGLDAKDAHIALLEAQLDEGLAREEMALVLLDAAVAREDE